MGEEAEVEAGSVPCSREPGWVKRGRERTGVGADTFLSSFSLTGK